MTWLAEQGPKQYLAISMAVLELDSYLTDKIACRTPQDMIDACKCVQQGDTWFVHLSDGGYSRLTICPAPMTGTLQVWLDRGLSLDKPKQRAAAIGLLVR